MITCFIRYTIDPDKLDDFEEYGKRWVVLIERYGGTHHGYFVPSDAPYSSSFSFPGLGEEGPRNIGIALFSFPTEEAYEGYRSKVSSDEECHAITAHFEKTKCFLKYERSFMRQVDRD